MLRALTLAGVTAVLLAGSIVPVLAEGPVLLTVTGGVSAPNRGPLDPSYDKLFTFNDVTFDKAHEFDLAALQALPQEKVRTDFPKGGKETEFSGPALKDVLAAAGATGQTVTIQAMDGYAVEIPLADMVAKGAVVALSRDGRPFGIGNFGPTQIVFPRGERSDLSDMPDDWWIWQIYRIDVQ